MTGKRVISAPVQDRGDAQGAPVHGHGETQDAEGSLAGSFDGAAVAVDPELARDVDLLCLDAGNTIIFLDHGRMASFCAGHGFAPGTAELVRREGDAKRAYERGAVIDVGWSRPEVASSALWGIYVGTMLGAAGLPRDRVAPMLDAIWPEHRRFSFWSRVPPGLVDALRQVRDAGVRVAVVSNSEGELEPFLAKLGLTGVLDLVIDSGLAGVEKPDPRIFRLALERFDVPPARAVHVGDVVAVDVVGARAAGMRTALIDPFGHYTGDHPGVPRIPGAAELARAIAATRAS